MEQWWRQPLAFFFSSRRRHTRSLCDWSSDVCSSDQLLHEIAPKATDLAILVNPNGTLAESQVTDAQAAMSAMGLRLHVLKAVSDAEIDAAFAAMEQDKIGGVLVSTDPTFGFKFRDKLIGLAAHYRVPTIYDSRDFAEA